MQLWMPNRLLPLVSEDLQEAHLYGNQILLALMVREAT